MMQTIQQFIKKHKLRMKVTEVDSNPNMDDMPDGSRHYKCVLSMEGRRMTVPYSMGPAHNVGPKLEEVLDCVASDSSGADQDFEAWCGDYGYDTDSRRAERTYNICVRLAKAFQTLLGMDAYGELLYETERA